MDASGASPGLKLRKKRDGRQKQPQNEVKKQVGVCSSAATCSSFCSEVKLAGSPLFRRREDDSIAEVSQQAWSCVV